MAESTSESAPVLQEAQRDVVVEEFSNPISRCNPVTGKVIGLYDDNRLQAFREKCNKQFFGVKPSFVKIFSEDEKATIVFGVNELVEGSLTTTCMVSAEIIGTMRPCHNGICYLSSGDPDMDAKTALAQKTKYETSLPCGTINFIHCGYTVRLADFAPSNCMVHSTLELRMDRQAKYRIMPKLAWFAFNAIRILCGCDEMPVMYIKQTHRYGVASTFDEISFCGVDFREGHMLHGIPCQIALLFKEDADGNETDEFLPNWHFPYE